MNLNYTLLVRLSRFPDGKHRNMVDGFSCYLPVVIVYSIRVSIIEFVLGSSLRHGILVILLEIVTAYPLVPVRLLLRVTTRTLVIKVSETIDRPDPEEMSHCFEVA